MTSITVAKAAGLTTSINPLTAPEGGLLRADNVIIRSKDVIEPRRGWTQLGGFSDYSYGTSSDSARDIYFFGSTLLIHYGHALNYPNGLTLARDTGSAFSAYSGTYTSPTSARMKSFQSQSRFYFATSAGVYALDTVAGTPRTAGVAKCLDVTAAYSSVGAITGVNGGSPYDWMQDDTRVAYRVTWGYTDANGKNLLGAPSGRAYFSNDSGGDVYPTFQVPAISGVSTSHFFQVHRTEASESETVDPPEACYQVYERQATGTKTIAIGGITASATTARTVVSTSHGLQVGDWIRVTSTETDIGPGIFPVATVADANTFTYTHTASATVTSTVQHTIVPWSFVVKDYRPESLLGDPLYTNAADGEGDLQSNYQPPLANDVAWWNERAWYANTTSKQRFTLQMLGTGGPEGVQNDDTITINGRTYTAKTTASAGTAEFDISGSSSAAIALEETARDLCRVINQDTSATVNAFYISAANETPGTILLEATTLGASAFSVYASRTGSWSPALTTGSTGAKTSSSDAAPHRVFYSKLQQPEAVPLLNYLDIGEPGKNILRIVPLRDKLFVFKSEGTYVISGSEPFRVDLFDRTAVLVAVDTPAEVNNKIYALTTQGVAAISDAGVQIVSAGIEKTILNANFTTTAYGASYESERCYLVGLQAEDYDNSSESITTTFVYNTMSGAWSRWFQPETGVASMRVSPSDDKLYIADSGSTGNRRVLKENKAQTSDDYADLKWERTATTVTSDSTYYYVTLNSVTDLAVGDTILDVSENIWGKVAAINSSILSVYQLNRLGGYSGQAFTTGTVRVYRPISCAVEWTPTTIGAPGSMKQFPAFSLSFKDKAFYNGEASFRTNLTWTRQYVDCFFADRVLPPPAEKALADQIIYIKPPSTKRVLVPQTQQQAVFLAPGFRVADAWAVWSLIGYTLEYRPVSERNSR